jgi:hypothetical protein
MTKNSATDDVSPTWVTTATSDSEVRCGHGFIATQLRWRRLRDATSVPLTIFKDSQNGVYHSVYVDLEINLESDDLESSEGFLHNGCLGGSWSWGSKAKNQRGTKICRLSWLTNSALVFEPKCGVRGTIAGSQPLSTAVHWRPNKLWRSNSIFNLCQKPLTS